jgi:5'-nucleotidase
MKSYLAPAVFVGGLCVGLSPALADFKLSILHFNDFHARIESVSKYDSTCSDADEAKGACFGGVARLKSAIDARRAAAKAAGENVILLDAGDGFQGSMFYTTYKSAVISEFFNKLGIDVATLGNHEFDDGPQETLKFLAAATFPNLLGNIELTPDSPLKDKLKGTTILTVAGEKIGVIGTLATDTAETSSPGATVKFIDDLAYVKGAVKQLEGQGVNKIILLSHVGYERDKQIAAAVDGIDVIVGGHSHTLLSNSDKAAAGPYPTQVKSPSGVEVPIVTAYAYSRYLGDLTVTFDDKGVVKTAAGEPLPLDAKVKPDETLTARIKELGAPIAELKAKIIGELTVEADGAKNVCRWRECGIGNLVADAMLEATRKEGITLAIQNGGGVRTGIEAGKVTMGSVLTVLPFQNTIATFKLKGEDVVAALENGLSKIEEGAGRFPQVAGMRYVADVAKPAGQRILSVEVEDAGKFVPIDRAKVYGVVSNNYMRQGGDGYTVFRDKSQNAYDYGPNLEDTVAAFIGARSPYTPKVGGRVEVQNYKAP